MALQNSLSTFDPVAKQQLMNWARRLTPCNSEQCLLVEQTLAAATGDPDALDYNQPTDRAMKILMLRLFRMSADRPRTRENLAGVYAIR